MQQQLRTVTLEKIYEITHPQAKKQGKTIGRPKKSDDNLKKAFDMYQSKAYTLQAIKDETGISKSTLYRYIDQLGE